MSGEAIGSEEFIKRLAALCASGVGPGLPRRQRAARILLGSMALCFEREALYTEREVGDVLQSWLEAAGPRVDLDHATMRRALVDHRYLTRDPRGTSYRLTSSHSDVLSAAWEGLDSLRILREARANAEQRKQSIRSGRPPD